jgi:hypothetical protein
MGMTNTLLKVGSEWQDAVDFMPLNNGVVLTVVGVDTGTVTLKVVDTDGNADEYVHELAEWNKHVLRGDYIERV